MSSKCNTSREENFLGGLPSETLARSFVDEVDNSLKLIVRDGKEITALREEEAQKTIEVLVSAALPGRMRVSEVYGSSKGFLQFSERSKLRAIIQRKAVYR